MHTYLQDACTLSDSGTVRNHPAMMLDDKDYVQARMYSNKHMNSMTSSVTSSTRREYSDLDDLRLGMCVCMYVCVYVYVCMYVCMYVWMYSNKHMNSMTSSVTSSTMREYSDLDDLRLGMCVFNMHICNTYIHTSAGQ